MNKTDVIIPRSVPIVHAPSWQSQLAGVINGIEELLTLTGNRRHIGRFHKVTTDFPLRVPLAYIHRIKRGDINDPLLKQILPLHEESTPTPGYVTDPLQESESNITPGIIHKYHGRVLLILTGTCAVNCRYCFRRHFPYRYNNISRTQWQQALDYIRRNHSISEVIYSGGDPLINSDKKLAALTHNIAAIDHVKRLRIHTRLPIVIPARVTDELTGWLTATRLQVSLVLHTNHPNELNQEVADALGKLRPYPITLLNQSVLLKGINDNRLILTALSERLYEMGVLPYYLHLMDKVQGAAHFNVATERARHLLGELSSLLPGYLVPKLAIEEPGKRSKILLAPIL